MALSILLNPIAAEAGGYYCSTCGKNYNIPGTHGGNNSCTGTFSLQSSKTIYGDSSAGCYRYTYKCSVCSAEIYRYNGGSLTSGQCCNKWSTEYRDSCLSVNGPDLTKYASTMAKYFEEYGRPCKCTGTAVRVTYTMNFNKNY